MKRKLKRRSVNRKVPKRFRRSRSYETRWQKLIRTKSFIISYDICEGNSRFIFPRYIYVGSVKSRINGKVGGISLIDLLHCETLTGKEVRSDMFKDSALEIKFIYHEKKTN